MQILWKKRNGLFIIWWKSFFLPSPCCKISILLSILHHFMLPSTPWQCLCCLCYFSWIEPSFFFLCCRLDLKNIFLAIESSSANDISVEAKHLMRQLQKSMILNDPDALLDTLEAAICRASPTIQLLRFTTYILLCLKALGQIQFNDQRLIDVLEAYIKVSVTSSLRCMGQEWVKSKTRMFPLVEIRWLTFSCVIWKSYLEGNLGKVIQY